MDSAGIPWYSTGTVNVTQGSSNVAGVGTNWVNAGLKVGDIFTIDKSRLYQITAVNSNTSLSLQEAYQGATGTAQVYFVIRNFAGTMQAQIAAQVSELVNKYESYIDTELKQITGPAGPTSFPYRGTWATGRSYNGLDVVQYGNQLYMALYGHTSTSANAPGATGTAWKTLEITASGDIITTNFGVAEFLHNSIYRGKSLGAQFTTAQSSRIRDGSFTDLWLGDYWDINNIRWRIADFNYFKFRGSPRCTDNHVVIIPDSPLYNRSMNSSNTTSGGYLGSEMHTSGLDNAKDTINQAFGEEHILEHCEFLSSEVTNGVVTKRTNTTCTVVLINEVMIMGHYVYASGTTMNNVVTARGDLGNKQLGLFRINTLMMNNGGTFWLRDVVNSEKFAAMYYYGTAANFGAMYADVGVRPYFLLY